MVGVMTDLAIKERLLKDSFFREAPLSNDITSVKIDLRANTHDVVTVTIRGMPAGQLVTDKFDSMTIARRLLPESLRMDKEPSTLVRNMEELAFAYATLLMEAANAVSHGSVAPLSAFLRKLRESGDVAGQLPGDGHLFVAHRKVRTEAEGAKPAYSPST